MDINIYTLEVAMKSRLAELRAAAAREALLTSARERRPGVLAALRAALPRVRWGQVLQSRITGSDGASAASAPRRLPASDARLQDLTPVTRR